MKQIIRVILALVLFSCNTQSEKTTKNIPSKTFKVDDVEIAKELLPTDKPENIIENKIGKTILFTSPTNPNDSYLHTNENAFYQTIYLAYSQHRPLILSPDDIWLTICQGVCIHVNQNFSKFENKLFNQNKPEEIVIRNDSLEFNPKHWADLMLKLSSETKKYTKNNLYPFFVPQFSTTTAEITTAYQITLLNTYKKVFKYVGASGCGIPSITLTGTPADWEELYAKLSQLDQFELEEWKQALRPIIKEFINARNGNPDITFWKDIFKDASEYGKYYVSGWFINFFPYISTLKKQNEVEAEVEFIYIKNEFLGGYKYLRCDYSSDNFPSGFVSTPIQWNNYLKNKYTKVLAYAGFMGIKQYEDKSLEPWITWAIANPDSKFEEHPEPNSNIKMVEHKEKFWYPQIVDSLSDSAVFNISQFKKPTPSYNYIKKIIADSIAQSSKITDKATDGLKVQIIILSNGGQDDITITKDGKNCNNPELEKTIKSAVHNLNGKWFPAITKIKSAIQNIYELPIGDFDQKIKVNSKIELEF